MRNCTLGLKISRLVSQASPFVFELGISVPSLRTCIPVADHTCTEKIGGDSIYFCGHPSRTRNRLWHSSSISNLYAFSQSTKYLEWPINPQLKLTILPQRKMIFTKMHPYQVTNLKLYKFLVSVCLLHILHIHLLNLGTHILMKFLNFSNLYLCIFAKLLL